MVTGLLPFQFPGPPAAWILGEQVVLLHEGEQPHQRRCRDPGRGALRIVGVGRRQGLVRVVSSLRGQPDLLEVVHALGACGRLAHFLDRGQEEADEDGNDGDHHQKLDQREAAP
jgi:hypothetical protein